MSIEEQLSNLPDSELKKITLKKILETEVNTSDEVYKKSFKEPYKVNLDVCGAKGYQIFGPTEYTYKIGEYLEDPDVSIVFRDMDYIRRLLRGENIDNEWGRDSKNVRHMNKKDLMISTRMRGDQRNAQVLLAKIPIFHQALQNFGTSRLTRYLRDEPEFISPAEEGEIASLMQKMLRESADITDNEHKKKFQGQILKINWNIAGNLAWQTFEETGYKYEFGNQLDDADIAIVIDNPEYAKRFLLDLPTNYAPGLDKDQNLLLYIKLPLLDLDFKDPTVSRLSLLRLPFFRGLLQKAAAESVEAEKKDERENFGHYIPVNLPMGDFENVAVPYKVLEHFINKASNIVLRTCPCRERWECKKHSIELGCIFMGDDTKNMALAPDEGYVATKEEAKAHVRAAMAEGLVPLLGRNVAEAENGHGIMDTGRFLAGCFCCECCCIGVKTREYGFASSMGGEAGGSMEGWKIKVDYEKCEGCGECVSACPFNFRKVVDGKIAVDPDKCIGCGRCENVCPNGAISVQIEDPDYMEKYIAKLESIVDVTDQTTKT